MCNFILLYRPPWCQIIQGGKVIIPQVTQIWN
nr:MAG TPA: hypothetical protein [Caudoviricetes sp.]